MQRKPLGDDPWRLNPWTPSSWGINDSGSPFSDIPGPTPGSWGINDQSPGCILGMTHGLLLETPETNPAPAASPVRVAATPMAPYILTFRHANVPTTPDHWRSSAGGPSKSGTDRAGYTKAVLRRNIDIDWDKGPTRDGKISSFARAVNVLFVLDPIIVEVSSDYPVDSCPYRVTLRHEIEDHANAFIRIFLSYRETLVKKLNAIPFPTERAPRWIKPKDIETSRDKLEKQVKEVIQTEGDSFVAAMEKDRQAKDSKEAYAAIRRKCPEADWEMEEDE